MKPILAFVAVAYALSIALSLVVGLTGDARCADRVGVSVYVPAGLFGTDRQRNDE